MKGWIGIGTTLLLLLFAATGGWYFFSPGWTLDKIAAAAEARDIDALSAYVDYPAFRTDLKAKLTARLEAQAKRDGDEFAPLAAAIGGALVGPAVDLLVTPAGLRAAFVSSAAVGDSQPVNRIEIPSEMRVGKKPQITRRGFSEFKISPEGKEGGLIFKRSGLSWKLSGIELDPEPARPANGQKEAQSARGSI